MKEFTNRAFLPWMSRLRHHIRFSLSQHPALYLPLARINNRHSITLAVVNRNTDIVIDGFPRSANSFCYWAIMLTQQHPVSPAHHLHAAAQIFAAAEMKIPTIVLIRDPVDTVLSYKIMLPYMNLKRLFQEYIQYYDSIWPYRDAYVIGTFPQVTSDFGEVIYRLNARFGTQFNSFIHSDENVRKVLAIIEKTTIDRRGDIDERGIPRPSDQRAQMKNLLYNALSSRDLIELRDRSYDIYARYTLLAAS